MNSTSDSSKSEVGVLPACEWAGLSDVGLVRKNNEDAFSVTAVSDAGRASSQPATGAVPALPTAGCVFIVSDGVGGANAGEVASAIAVQVVPELLASYGLRPPELTNRACGQNLESAIRAANGRVRQEAASDPQRSGMAATLSVLWLLDGRAVIGQVGDSRIYRHRAGRLTQLTHDQSEVGRMVRSGQLSESQAKGFRGRNVIDQSLGMGEDTFAPEIDWVEVLPGDLFLLCSDGLVDRLENRHLADIIEACGHERRSLAETATELVAQSNRASGRDNTTALLVRVPDASASAVVPPTLPSVAAAMGTTPSSAGVPAPGTPAVPPRVSAAAPAVGSGQLDRRGVTFLVGALTAGVLVGTLGFWLFVHRPRLELSEKRHADAAARASRGEQDRSSLERASVATIAERDSEIRALEGDVARLRKDLALARESGAGHERSAAESASLVAARESDLKAARDRVRELEAARDGARGQLEQLRRERDDAVLAAEAAEKAAGELRAAAAAALAPPPPAPADSAPATTAPTPATAPTP